MSHKLHLHCVAHRVGLFCTSPAAQSSAVVIIIVASLGIVINLLALLAFYSNPEYHHHMHHHHEHHSQASPLHAVQIRDAFTNPSEVSICACDLR